MNLRNLKLLLADNGCQSIYVKELSPNDNSKNQVYLGGSFEILNILPLREIRNVPAGNWEKERFKSYIDFSWVMDDGNIYSAPHSQLIMYPKYPEVRFSGFLLNCRNPPSDLMTKRLEGRLLLISVTNKGSVLGYVASADSEISQEYNKIDQFTELGIFKIIDLPQTENNKEKLLLELSRIHRLEWIDSRRLDNQGRSLPCISSNCGGYTLEAELGIRPNGYSDPDYLGWEIKQFGVTSFARLNSAVVTLMTPEPTSGYYATNGAEAFVRKYGYFDLMGRSDRMNFGGIHKFGSRHARTNLELVLSGFDFATGKIRSIEGKIALIDRNSNEAASWSFSNMLLHWNRKHNQACYVPSLSNVSVTRRYKYGDKVTLGIGTDYLLFLKQMALGNIYYDPGIKVENLSAKPKVKKRSQFRIKSQYLNSLYKKCETVSLI